MWDTEIRLYRQIGTALCNSLFFLLLNSAICYYEVKESKILKLLSVALITWMTTDLILYVIEGINRFEMPVINTIVLDITRTIVHLCCTLVDLYYYGTDLKEYFASRNVK